ncbi:hypothetical protein LINPERHAP2_LOCUS19948 [Linum perenne]
MISIFSWNCRGAGHKKFLASFRSYREKFHPSVVFILEPRISGRKAERVCRKLGYEECIRSDTVGFSGGIWVLRRPGEVKLDCVVSTSQFIHLQGTCGACDSFFLNSGLWEDKCGREGGSLGWPS